MVKEIFITFYVLFAMSYIFLFGNLALAFPVGTQQSSSNATVFSFNTTNTTYNVNQVASLNRPTCNPIDVFCLVGYTLSLTNISTEYALLNMFFVALTIIFLYIVVVDAVIPFIQAVGEIIPF